MGCAGCSGSKRGSRARTGRSSSSPPAPCRPMTASEAALGARPNKAVEGFFEIILEAAEADAVALGREAYVELGVERARRRGREIPREHGLDPKRRPSPRLRGRDPGTRLLVARHHARPGEVEEAAAPALPLAGEIFREADQGPGERRRIGRPPALVADDRDALAGPGPLQEALDEIASRGPETPGDSGDQRLGTGLRDGLLALELRAPIGT